MEGWRSLTLKGGSRIFLFCPRGGQNFFSFVRGDQFFLPRSKGGPEKIVDSSSQIDGPPILVRTDNSLKQWPIFPQYMDGALLMMDFTHLLDCLLLLPPSMIDYGLGKLFLVLSKQDKCFPAIHSTAWCIFIKDFYLSGLPVLSTLAVYLYIGKFHQV